MVSLWSSDVVTLASSLSPSPCPISFLLSFPVPFFLSSLSFSLPCLLPPFFPHPLLPRFPPPFPSLPHPLSSLFSPLFLLGPFPLFLSALTFTSQPHTHMIVSTGLLWTILPPPPLPSYCYQQCRRCGREWKGIPALSAKMKSHFLTKTQQWLLLPVIQVSCYFFMMMS